MPEPIPRGSQLLKLTLLGASVLLFAYSLSCNAYYVEDWNDGMPGFLALLMGWPFILNGEISWLANPLLLLAWLCLLFKRDVFARASAAAAVLVASTFLLPFLIHADMAGHLGRVSEIGLGYWLWFASMTFALAAACWPPMRTIKRVRAERAVDLSSRNP